MVDAGNAGIQASYSCTSALRVLSNYTFTLWLIALYVYLFPPPFECVMSLKLTLNTVALKYSDHFETWIPVRLRIIKVLHPGPGVSRHLVHLVQDGLESVLLRPRHVHHQDWVLGDDGLPREDGPGGHHPQPLASNVPHCEAPALEIGR